MATGVVLPIEHRATEWHDIERKFRLCPTQHGSARLLSSSMTRPTLSAEPREGAFSHKPSLPPFSTFLSDAGHPALFPQARPQQIRVEPLLPGGASLGNHALQPSSFRPSGMNPVSPTETLQHSRNGQSEMRTGSTWSYPNTSPLGAHSAVPGIVPTNIPTDHASGPALLREEVLPGQGPCYVYEDGTIVQKIINGDTVNPKWGTTKAGKPRKRLGQACNTCREKKIKCDPSVPKCAQCQKFGRECKFDST